MQLLTKNIENIQGTAHDFNFSKSNIFKHPCWKNLIQHNTSYWCSNLACGKSKTLWKNNTMEIMMITNITNKKGQEKNNQKVIHLILVRDNWNNVKWQLASSPVPTACLPQQKFLIAQTQNQWNNYKLWTNQTLYLAQQDHLWSTSVLCSQ